MADGEDDARYRVRGDDVGEFIGGEVGSTQLQLRDLDRT
jgi:hypothetical protein